jgi:hypothetical protein
VERFADVLTLQVWQVLEDLLRRHTVSDHGHDGRDRDTQATDAGLATHLPRLDRDPLELQDDNATWQAERSPDTQPSASYVPPPAFGRAAPGRSALEVLPHHKVRRVRRSSGEAERAIGDDRPPTLTQFSNSGKAGGFRGFRGSSEPPPAAANLPQAVK